MSQLLKHFKQFRTMTLCTNKIIVSTLKSCSFILLRNEKWPLNDQKRKKKKENE
jgi:hypothetical protein